MKLQKHKTRKDKDYSKYVIVMPEDKVKQAGFQEGDELEAEAKEGEIKLRRK